MLFDTYPHITKSFEKMMENHGRKIDYAETKRLFEITFGTVFDYYGTTEEQKAEFRKYEHDFSFEEAHPFPNTYKTLKEVKDSGCRNFLYTHRGASVFHYLDKYGMTELFEYCVTGDNKFELKPSPEAMNHIIEHCGLERSETVMIGDREIDVLAGKNAGTFGCLFTAEEKETAADFVVDDIYKVTELINKEI